MRLLENKLFQTLLVLMMSFCMLALPSFAVGAENENSTIEVLDNSVDTSELTSDDWSQIQQEISSAMNSEVEISVTTSDSPFENIKSNDGTNGNDSVWFLILGIGLVGLGVLLLALVIFLNVRIYCKKHALKTKKQKTKAEKETNGSSE